MKIFISHSSKNSHYGNAIVDLLVGIGVDPQLIIFTSNDAYGIPIGQNIFNWLKARINEKPYVIYLLSPEYYTSIACLNEMGAAWIVENKHTMIFTSDFKLDSYEFLNGAIDPREIGFFINNQDKLILFIESLRTSFDISNNLVLINQNIQKFLKAVNTSTEEDIKDFKETSIIAVEKEKAETIIQKSINASELNFTDKVSRFFLDLQNDKLKDEDVLLIYYIIDTARYKLGTGWREQIEIENIKTWEEVHDLNNILSKNYSSVLRKLEMKKLTEISEITSYGNAREICLIEPFRDEMLNMPIEIFEQIKKVVSKSRVEDLPF